MNEYQFGGRVTLFDQATEVEMSVNVFGSFRCAGDEAMGRWSAGQILNVFPQIASESPSAARVCADPMAFMTTIGPAINAALAENGVAPVQIASFNAVISPETIEALAAAATKAKSAASAPVASPIAGPLTIVAGAPVLVQWSDGNRYPGTVQAVGDGQIQIGFPNGQLQWVPAQYVSRA